MSNILFVHLPRTAGTLIREYGRETKYINYYANYKQRDGHLPASKINEPDKWFKFGLVRNPYDWYVSQYFYFIGKSVRYKEKAVRAIESGIYEGVDAGLYGSEFISVFPTFEDWILYGLKSDLPYFWFTNVYNYMFCDKGKLLLDFVGKYENLYKDVDAVLKLNGIIPDLKLEDFKGDKNASVHRDYMFYYDNKLIDIIYKKDGKLIEKYGYSF